MPRPECPAENTVAVEESSFFNADGINWTTHTIGWAIAGGCAALVCLPWTDQSLAVLTDTNPRPDVADNLRERFQALQVCRALDGPRGSP